MDDAVKTGHDFLALVLTTNNLLIMAAVSVFIQAVKHAAPRAWQSGFLQRTSRIWPILLCTGALFIPGLTTATFGERVLLGAVLGAFSGQFYGFLSKNVLQRLSKPALPQMGKTTPPTDNDPTIPIKDLSDPRK